MPLDFSGPVNLGNPGEFTMIELAEKIKDLTGSRSELVHKELPIDDPKQRQPDINLAQDVLQWRPSVKFEDGLKATISYFEQLLSVKRKPI
jgi:UDP-glucuronate decarboxylase